MTTWSVALPLMLLKWAPLQVLPNTLKMSWMSKHIPSWVNGKVTSFIFPAVDPVLIYLLRFCWCYCVTSWSTDLHLCSCKCWSSFEMSGCCGSKGALRACRQSWPRCPPPTVCDEAAILASGYKHTRRGAGARGGRGERGGMGQRLNLSVLSLNLKRELLTSVTFYTVFNPSLSWQTRG